MLTRRLLLPITLIVSLSSAVATAAMLEPTKRAHTRRAPVAHKRAPVAQKRPARSHRPTTHHRAVRRPGRSAATSPASTTKTTSVPAEPVLVGDQVVETTIDNNSAGVAEAFPFASHTTGTARTIHVYVDSRSNATTLIAGLFSDGGGRPGALLAAGARRSPQAGTWNAVSLSAATVSAGHTYWVALLGRGGTVSFRDHSGGAWSVTSRQTTLTSLPGAWATARQWHAAPASVYVTGSTVTVSPPNNGDGSTPTQTPTPTPTPVPTPPPSGPPTVTAPAPPPVPQNTTAPVVSGQAVQGQQLTTSNGSWSNGPTSYAYKWQDCDASGASCSNISGATSSSYVLGSGDVGHTIRSVVTASNAGGSASPASSSPTTVVTASSGGGGGSTSCTTTVSSLSSVVSLSSSEPNGAVICIAPGSYGQLTLSATRSGYVTIAAASGPGTVKLSGLQIDSSGDFLHLDGLTVSDNTELGSSPNGGSAPSNIQITNTDSEGFQVEAGAVNLLFDHDYSHDGPYGFLLNGSRYPVQGGCCQTANYPYIQNVTIENSEISNPQADAFQVKGFENVTIANNDIWDVNQNGNHNDGVQTVHGGSNLTITHNYFHDGNVELFMIKDGLINGLNITDNLSVRQSSANNPSCGGCSTAVMGQVYAPTNAVIENNTFLQPAFLLRSQVGLVGNGNPDYPEPSNVTVSHNVITQFRAQDDDQNGSIGAFATAMSESNDIFGTWSKNYLTAPFPGPGTTFNNNPQFMCGTSCGNGTPAGDDYRLASNPNDIGIDWTPNQQSYGPVGS